MKYRSSKLVDRPSPSLGKVPQCAHWGGWGCAEYFDGLKNKSTNSNNFLRNYSFLLDNSNSLYFSTKTTHNLITASRSFPKLGEALNKSFLLNYFFLGKSKVLGNRWLIRLRHPADNSRSDFATFSWNTPSIPTKKCLHQNPNSLAVCSCRMDHRLPDW